MSKYKNGSEKVPLRLAWQYSKRGLGILHKMMPGNLSREILNNTLWGISPMLALFFSSLIISELAGERDIQRIVIFVSLAVGQGFLFSLITQWVQYVNTKRGSRDFWHYVNFEMNKQYATMDYVYVEDTDVNNLISDIKQAASPSDLGLNRLYYSTLGLISNAIALIAASILLSGAFVPVMILLIAVSIGIPALIEMFMQRWLSRIRQTFFANLSKCSALGEYLNKTFIFSDSGAKDVRMFNFHKPILSAVTKSYDLWQYGGYRKADSKHNGVRAATGIIFNVLAYLVIGLRALNGLHDIGEVVRLVGAVGAFSSAMVAAIRQFAYLRENAPYLGMLYDYYDLPTTKYQGTLTTEKRADSDYELAFENVSFKYPGTENYVLKNINLKFNINERLAIVGMNGSGKTTAVKLLCRLYEPTEGIITLNGIDIRKYNYDEYISIFAVVFQDFALVGLPLGQNVAASADYDPKAVRDALKKTGFGNKINLKTPLYKEYDENGRKISGGEAQKIALARAIYKDAPVVILDEPTAALDPLAEAEVYGKFSEIVGEKTSVFISHRLSSTRFCHDIAVFHEGMIIQRGSHDELIADAKGKYHELWNAQAQHYKQEQSA